MAKFKYVAQLGSGREVTRNSNRIYTHHWRAWATDEQGGGDSGFAGSYELASKAVGTTISRIRKCRADAPTDSEIVEAKAVSVTA